MTCNFRHVAWAGTEDFQTVAEALARADDASLRYAANVIGVWLTRLAPSKIPRSILCTYNLLVAFLEHSDQSLALALMRFVSLLSSEDQDRDRPYLATPLLSLAKQVGLPSWLVDLRNDIAHGSLPSSALLASGFHWASGFLTNFWLSNAKHMAESVARHNEQFNAAVTVLTAAVKGSSDNCLDSIEAVLNDRLLSIPLVRRAAGIFLSLTVQAKRKRSRILDVCSSASQLLELMRRKHVMHHFIVCFLLSCDSESDPAELANSVEWSLCWMQAVFQSRMGNRTDLSKYLDSEACALFDWRRAVEHVIYNNCCLETRELCMELIRNIVPDLSAKQRGRMVRLLDLYLGLTPLVVDEMPVASGKDSKQSWTHAVFEWADIPLGVDMGHKKLISKCPLAGENAPTSRQHQGLLAQNATRRCEVRFLYTLVVTEKEKVGKIKSSLPPNLTVKEIK
ncbi:hypothetical protein FBUS_11089 [Fasciolopsis buskii]|uniref:Large ribosomal subunit protein eL38 n=1 Tax=Fasciolopsis buskii TaxID=27845 RepID=A0A8E0RVZ9_9TREM|nr:hypothetical protein FBUS_11089 [Fasciolopsis buski]